MASVATPTQSQQAKRVYGNEYERLPFHPTLITDRAPFTDKYKIGETFRWLMELAMEHGMTYNTTGSAEATLADAIVGVNQQAEVNAYETIMRTRMNTRAYEEASKAGDAAFENATKQRLQALQTGHEFRREHSYLYGQEGLFKVSSIDTGVITITDDTWCPTLAIRLINAILEAFDAQAATANQHNGDLTVSAVDLDAKTITVTGTSSSVVANDWLYFKGARTTTAHKEQMGLHKLMTTTSGTVQNIALATYPWAKPNVSSSFGRPTMLLILKAMRKLVGRNTIASKKDDKQNTTLFLPSPSYEILNSDLMSSRRFDGSYNRSKGTSGVETIEYYGQTGVTELMVHPLLRDSDGLAIGPNNLFRVGITDLKFVTGPDENSDLWTQVADKNTYEARTTDISQIALFAPGRTVALTGITE
jgi:hypothetical protein